MIYLSHSSISRAGASTTIFVDSSAKLLFNFFYFRQPFHIFTTTTSAKETDACSVIYDLATSCLNLPICFCNILKNKYHVPLAATRSHGVAFFKQAAACFPAASV